MFLGLYIVLILISGPNSHNILYSTIPELYQYTEALDFFTVLKIGLWSVMVQYSLVVDHD